MAVWSYMPQEVLTEAARAFVRLTQVAPATAVSGYDVSTTGGIAILRYTIRDAPEVASMVSFFNSHGAAYAFDFWNPNTQRTHRARFDGAMTVQHFEPLRFRTGEIPLVLLVGS